MVEIGPVVVDFGLVMVAMFLALIVLRVPVWIALLLPPLIYIGITDQPLFVAAQRIGRTLNSYSLIAVPMFVYLGAVMNNSGITQKIFDFARDAISHLAGGLAYVNIFTSLIFSGMSGSALADIGGIGRVLMHSMTDEGYSKGYSAALTSASATIGPLFPPSIPLIIYGVLSRTSVVDLLLAGAVPALLLFAIMIAGTAVLARWKDFPTSGERPSVTKIIRSFVIAVPALGAPVILVYGMMRGLFGATEIAVVTVVYMLLINTFVYRIFEFRYIWESAVEAAITTSTIMILLAAATLFSFVITLEGTHETFANLLFSLSENKLVLLLLVNIMLLVLGLFLEPLSAMLISIPLVVPTLVEVGVDPVHIGVIMVFNLMIGLLTPPLGLSVYLANDIVEADIEDTLRDLVPYYVVLLITLLIITYVPIISLWLPGR